MNKSKQDETKTINEWHRLYGHLMNYHCLDNIGNKVVTHQEFMKHLISVRGH